MKARRLASVRFCAAANSRRSLRVATTRRIPSWTRSRIALICLSCWAALRSSAVTRTLSASATGGLPVWDGCGRMLVDDLRDPVAALVRCHAHLMIAGLLHSHPAFRSDLLLRYPT